MIRATYPVLALFHGSVQSLTRPLSPVDRCAVENSAATRRRQSFSRWKALIHPPAGQFSRPIHHRKLQKHIQYPETGSGSVQ
jgi:hypothetical protein